MTILEQDYEARRGIEKIWDGSEPTSAVTGQRPAFATAASDAPDSESSQGSSNARGQISSVSDGPVLTQAEADELMAQQGMAAGARLRRGRRLENLNRQALPNYVWTQVKVCVSMVSVSVSARTTIREQFAVESNGLSLDSRAQNLVRTSVEPSRRISGTFA